MHYVEGPGKTRYKASAKLRRTLEQDSALVLELSENKEFSSSFLQGQLSWQYYF